MTQRTFKIEPLELEPHESVALHDWCRLFLFEDGNRVYSATVSREVANDWADYFVTSGNVFGLVSFAKKRGSRWAQAYA